MLVDISYELLGPSGKSIIVPNKSNPVKLRAILRKLIWAKRTKLGSVVKRFSG